MAGEGPAACLCGGAVDCRGIVLGLQRATSSVDFVARSHNGFEQGVPTKHAIFKAGLVGAGFDNWVGRCRGAGRDRSKRQVVRLGIDLCRPGRGSQPGGVAGADSRRHPRLGSVVLHRSGRRSYEGHAGAEFRNSAGLAARLGKAWLRAALCSAPGPAKQRRAGRGLYGENAEPQHGPAGGQFCGGFRAFVRARQAFLRGRAEG
jgi:hypothetical protein